MGPRSAAACARKHAYEADREGYVQRGRTERKNRRVGLRPAPDTMSLLTGYLPAEQGVACLKALRQQTDAVKAPVIPAAGIKSWPTRWWNGSPGKPKRPT